MESCYIPPLGKITDRIKYLNIQSKRSSEQKGENGATDGWLGAFPWEANSKAFTTVTSKSFIQSELALNDKILSWNTF